MLRLAVIPDKGSREEMSSGNKGGGWEEGPGFCQLGLERLMLKNGICEK